MREFTSEDVIRTGQFARIQADRTELVDAQPDWMKRGLQETATGYGKRLNTGLKISYNGKLYRLYCTCYSNAGTVWFTAKGERIIVS